MNKMNKIDNTKATHLEYSGTLVKFKRLWRSILMWGLHRTYAKVVGRLNVPLPIVFSPFSRTRELLLSGCGQFGGSTASFFISKKMGNRFLGCYDINLDQSEKIKNNYGYKYSVSSFEELLSLKGAKYLFIASNHASHTDQAIAGLEAGLSVHVEKPISVTWEQLARLRQAVKGKEDKIFVGYNRPFAKGTQLLRDELPAGDGPFTIQYFVAGHAISADHWYYDPKEGTRICGNVGHWIDLTVHLLCQREMPDTWTIEMMCSDPEMREENFSLNMRSEKGDIVNMVFTARGEPFDGVSETISIQHGPLMAKIEDYKTLTIWNKDKVKTHNFYPKDVGHESSVNQLFNTGKGYKRPWDEILNSSLLMMHITDMVKMNINHSEFSFSAALEKLQDLAEEKKA